MLIKDVVKNYGDKIDYLDENYGNSPMAERFGVKRYPAVFVDDALIARPNDFGFYGNEEKPHDGKYVPWRDTKNHEKFKEDLTRMIELWLRGEEITSLKMPSEEVELTELPDFTMIDLQGNRISTTELAGKVVLIEFWATWCPPCHKTLSWLTEIRPKYSESVVILAVSVESLEADVRKLATAKKLPFPIIFGKKEQVLPFGNLTAVPTMYVFGKDGRTASIFYGAPEDLHESVERLLEKLL